MHVNEINRDSRKIIIGGSQSGFLGYLIFRVRPPGPWINYWRREFIINGISFKYRRKLIINEQAGKNLTNYQVLLKLDETNFDFSKTQQNGDDIRFVDINNNFLSYWIEKWDSFNKEARIWIKIPSIPANSTINIWMYYGNQTISSKSNVTSTFEYIINNLVASWHFDEGSGTKIYDSSGNNYNGDVSGALWYNGIFGSALKYNQDDYVEFCDIPEIKHHDATFAAWIKINNLDRDGDIFTKGPHSTNVPILIWYDKTVGSPADIGAGNTKTISVLSYDGSVQHWVAAPSNSINDNNWHHIIIIIKVDQNMIKIYIDGQLKASNIKGGWQGIQDTPDPIRTGAANPVNTQYGLVGQIDEVFIFNKALSDEEITNLYNNYGYTTTNLPHTVLIKKYVAPEPLISIGPEEYP